jgi:hypothetical protein
LSRYGWTWRELLYGVPYADLIALAQVAAEEEAERERASWIRAAFIGWQVYLTTPLDRGRRHLSFSQWLDTLGLGDKHGRTVRSLERERARAKANAARAAEAFRKARGISVVKR